VQDVESLLFFECDASAKLRQSAKVPADNKLARKVILQDVVFDDNLHSLMVWSGMTW